MERLPRALRFGCGPGDSGGGGGLPISCADRADRSSRVTHDGDTDREPGQVRAVPEPGPDGIGPSAPRSAGGIVNPVTISR